MDGLSDAMALGGGSERLFFGEPNGMLGEVLDGSPVATFVVDQQHRIVLWNRACGMITGVAASEMLGSREPWRPFYPDKRPILADIILNSALGDEVEHSYHGVCRRSPIIPGGWEAEDFFPHMPGGGKWLAFTAAPLHDQTGKVVGAVETMQDVTASKEMEERLHHQANHDVLTGLANRALLNDRLEQAVAHAGREQRLMAVAFIDLDHFKMINDSLGHQAGDDLIKTIALRIARCVRDGDTVARVGGDEFVVLLYALDREEDVTDVLRRISDEVARPAMIGRHEFMVTASTGVALYPRDGLEAPTLLMNADIALYRAKESGRNCLHFYAKSMNERLSERVAMERDLRRALERDEFLLHYQPQIDVTSGLIVGVEALLRWNHPERGLVPPGRFVPLAEELGLIVPIGEWVLRTACTQARLWAEEGIGPLRMAINLSARQFAEKGIEELIAGIVRDHGGDETCLELELTESMVMHNPVEAAAILGRLRAAGLRLSMDDFGTGYSSLGYLKAFPFDILKIDQSFVRDILSDRGAGAIARAVVSLAHSLGLKVIAEGVEEMSQFKFLEAEGCDEVQGFLFCRPLPADQLTSILSARMPFISRD